MTERRKLEEKWEMDEYRGHTVLPKDIIIQLGKLVESCPHSKTHWIQEIDSVGQFKGKLYKRCYLCGFNIDELEAEPEFIEDLLNNFDKECEDEKVRQAGKVS